MSYGLLLIGLFFAQFLFGFGWGMMRNQIRNYVPGRPALSIRWIKIIMSLSLALVLLESARLVYLDQSDMIIRTAAVTFVFVSSVLYGMYIGEHQKWINPIQFIKLILSNKD
jgi:hypothetical protein